MPKALPVVLLTDFGPHSPYVGQMKLVLEARAPGVRVLDLAHDLPPHDVAAGVLVLTGAQRFLPQKCVVCAVVDPGVGGARRIVAARYAGGLFVVCPDNGLPAAFAARGNPQALHAVTKKKYFLPETSAVFHGRDVFAPVAAALATGTPPGKLGPRIGPRSLVPAPWPEPKVAAKSASAQVVHIDRFGNLITNLPERAVKKLRPKAARIGRRVFPFFPNDGHYAAVPKGKPLALIGSYGYLELALREASAARATRAQAGTKVTLT